MSLGFGFGFPRRWPGAKVWTPAQIPTALWLDAADSSTITLNGSTVSQWNDKSGNGRNAVQATAANQPGWGVGRNLLQWSEEFNNAFWTKRGTATITPNDTTAPNGTLTADRLSGLNTATNDIFNSNYLSFVMGTPGAAYTPSIYIKRISNTGTFSIGNTVNDNLYGRWTIDLAQLPDAWVRITATTTGVTVNVPFVFDPTGYGGILMRGITGGALSMHIWGAQINPGTTADQYQQTTSAAQPLLAGINGKPTLSFDGTNDLLGYNGAFLANTNYTVAALHFRSVDKTANFFFGGTTQSANQNFLMGYEVPSTKFRWGQYANDVDTFGQTYVTGLPSIAIARQSSTDGKNTYINGVSGGFSANTTPLSSNSGAGIGGFLTNFFNGGIAEIVMTTSALSTQDRQRLEGYLAWKWGGF